MYNLPTANCTAEGSGSILSQRDDMLGYFAFTLSYNPE